MPIADGSPRFRVQSQVFQNLWARFGKLALRLLLVLAPLVVVRGCFLTYVPPDRIGLRQVELGSGSGLSKEPVLPGYRREITGYERVETFPHTVQVVEFTNSNARAAGAHRRVNAVKVPTVDGYPVDVDVTVLYRLVDPYQVVWNVRAPATPMKKRWSSASPILWSSSFSASCWPSSSTAASGWRTSRR